MLMDNSILDQVCMWECAGVSRFFLFFVVWFRHHRMSIDAFYRMMLHFSAACVWKDDLLERRQSKIVTKTVWSVQDTSTLLLLKGTFFRARTCRAATVLIMPNGPYIYVPLAHAGTLLGKITTFEDKHTLAADALLVKLQQALRRLSQRRSSWDERVAFFQWIMRGAIAYVPLVGLPPPIELHKIDAAFQHLLLAGLCVRSTVERMSLLVAASSGGLQIPSVVESVLAAAASDLLLLLSGYTTASILARDALREVLFLPGAEAEQATGLVVQAIRLLAHYGIYINVQTDHFTSRVLDGLPAQSAHLLVGPYKSTPPSVTVARVGFVANTSRLLFQSWDMEGRPAHSWSAVGLYQEVLPPAFLFTPLQCSRAVAHAQAIARRTECSLLRPGFPPPQIPEEWPATAWEHPALSASPRADYLDSFTPFPTGADFGIFSDGGFSGGDKASFSCQARSFGDPPGYWDSSTVMTSPIVSRLPTAYGNAACDIHTAELMGMIAGLRYRSPAIGTCMLVTEAPFSLFSAAFPMHTLRRVSSAQPTSR